MPRQPARGRLLVATPQLGDPNFARTVVLLLEHADEGTFGIVLNRPSQTPLDAVLPAVAAAAEPAVVFAGGPVQPQVVVAVGSGGEIAEAEVMPGLHVVDLAKDRPAAVRVFAGYAGWSGAQLEREIAHGSWFVVDGRPDDALTDQPDTLWRVVVARQGALYRTASEDPSLN